jgi:hypothetical protein
MNKYYGKELETYNGKLFVNDQEMYPYFRAFLCNLGVADTRCGDLAEAMAKLHSAISECGTPSLYVIEIMFPKLISACRLYGQIEEMRTDFTDENGRDYK